MSDINFQNYKYFVSIRFTEEIMTKLKIGVRDKIKIGY